MTLANRNITLSLPEETIRGVKLIAVKKDTSISALLAEVLDDLITRDNGFLKAEREFMALAEAGFDLGTQGKVTWSRDELHER